MSREQIISVMIVDDEPLARHGLRTMIEAEKGFDIVAEASDGDEALRLFRKHSPAVLFLDIQMPEIDGFDVLNALPKQNMPLVVFVTAYNEFAVKAFTEHALDYVLKPLDTERIHSALHRVREMVRLTTSASYSDRISEALRALQSTKKYLERITIRSAGKISFISVNDILWIEAAADYIILHTRNGKQTTREMIGSIEQQLDPSRFIRIHRSTIVNLNIIRELRPEHHGEYTAILDQGTTLTVSRSYRKKIDHLL
ncbi:MAG: LytTR family DNA-binding domain-containing protein [Bacteriovoracaceae bacterium]|nr:LytTR family DNA-binding domain-containing protein [Bacteroidota bacterium]